MKKWKTILALALSAAMSLSLLAGCGGGAASGNVSGGGAAGGETGRVYWLNFKPELDETAQDLAKAYTDKTGVPVQVITAASGTYQQTLTAEMDKNAPPTLFVIGNTAGVADWGDYAMDLTGTAIANELNTDAYNLYDDAGKLVSIGYCYECYGIIVNPDLVQQAGHSMDEIKDFASLKAVVEDIHTNAATLGFDAFTPATWTTPPPGASPAIWPTWSTSMSRRTTPGPSAPPPSPAPIWTTSRTSTTCASTTA